MKKILTIMLLLVAMNAGAQDIQFNEEGCYEQKKVVSIENATVSDLYTRALESLSDWAGSQMKTKADIDVQDKDKGLIVYKGMLYLGFCKMQFGYGWETFADFTMKVRCKDGKAQITVTIPSMSYFWNANDVHTTVPINELLPEYTHKTQMPIKKATRIFAPTIPTETEKLINQIGNKMIATEDDF